MLGSPARGRRRRLIQAFAPTNAAENYYTSVPSTSSGSSFRRRRQSPKAKSGDSRKQRRNAGATKSKAAGSTGFRPIDPKADHGYRIDVARDGSMITAVPIEEQPLRRGGEFKSPQRTLGGSSPILFSQPRSSPNASSNGSTAWSQQGLLDARGKQRHKMKRMRPKAKANTTAAATKKTHNILPDHNAFPDDPFDNAVHTARDKLKHAKGFLAFTGTNHNSAQHQCRPKRQESAKSGKPPPTPAQRQQPRRRSRSKAPKVSWDLPQSQQVQAAISNPGNKDDADASFSSFPLLSGHKFDDSITDGDGEKQSSEDKAADDKNKNDAKKSESRTTDINANVTSEGGDTQSFEALLQQRMAEILSQQRMLAENISKKDVIKGTLITAIDGNLEKSRKQMKVLEEEMKEIKRRLKLNSSKKKKKQHQITHIETIQRKEDAAGVRLPRSPTGAYDMDSVEVGDPSITADTESVAALFRKGNARGMTAGLDPPARPDPLAVKEGLHPLYKRERKEPDGPRISAVLRGNNAVRAGAKNANRNGDRIPAEPPTPTPSASATKSASASPKPMPFRPVPLQRYQQIQAPRQQHRYPPHKKKSEPPQSQKRGKFVHFNLPQDSDSAELKFESINSNDSSPLGSEGVIGADGGEEEISWKEEHYDVEAFNEDTGSVISSEHHELYRWTDKERHVVVSEHYSRENHHRRHRHGGTDDEMESQPAPTNHENYNGNRGVSSDSVETDPDLGFIHTVAAVVIQTAVRRFLAEIAVEERLYAVNVIQTAVCNWMARIKRNPYFDSDDQNSDRMVHDDQNSDIIQDDQHPDQNGDQILNQTHEEQKQTIYCSQRPPQRTKQVRFEDDYNEFRDFAATEIQRCYRGWWARDGLEVDHFAATTIQRIFRGWWTREALEVDRYCSVEIQRIVRGHLSRMSYIYDLYCIIVAQSVVRRYLAFYTSAVRLANILYIQAIFRGYRVRAELMRYVRNGQEVAATFIQSQWRSYDAHMNYINTLADILIVQSVARRWLILRKIRRRKAEMRPKYGSTGYGRPRANYNRRNVPISVERNNTSVWQQHRMNVVSRPLVDQNQYSRREDCDAFHRESAGCEEWYDGNKSETSDLLKNWKGRKSR